jgi:hypothetical protein
MKKLQTLLVNLLIIFWLLFVFVTALNLLILPRLRDF